MGKTSFGANEARQSTATPVVEPRPAEGNHVAEVFAQARALDAQMEIMRSQYAGKVIVFHDGRVVCAADTEEEAISRIPDGKRGLPLVIRRIPIFPVPDFMGGPKGE